MGRHRVLIACERRREERPGIQPAARDDVADVRGRIGRAAFCEFAAKAKEGRRETRDRQGNRFARQGGDTPRELGGQILRRER